MSNLTLVGGQPFRPVRQARRDVYRGAGRAPSSRLGFGEAPPLKHRPRGAAAAEPAAGPVEKVWVRCHICAKMLGNPAVVVHEPQCYRKWCTRELAKPPSRRLPPPQRPQLEAGDGAVEAYNELAQAASDLSCLCPCPKCARTFLPDRIEAHVRTCEEAPDPDAEPAPKHSWGAITRVGDGWGIDELQRFCRQRRVGSATVRYERDLKRVGERVKHSGAVKTDPWDVNGLSKRELIVKINANLRRDGAAEAEAAELRLEQEDFKEWLSAVAFPAKPKTRQSVFSERLVPRA